MKFVGKKERMFFAADSKDFTFVGIKFHGPIGFPFFEIKEIILEGSASWVDLTVNYSIIWEKSNLALSTVREVIYVWEEKARSEDWALGDAR